MTASTVNIYSEQFKIKKNTKVNVKLFRFRDPELSYRLTITKLPVIDIHRDKIIVVSDNLYKLGTELGIILHDLQFNNDNK